MQKIPAPVDPGLRKRLRIKMTRHIYIFEDAGDVEDQCCDADTRLGVSVRLIGCEAARWRPAGRPS